MIHIVRYLGAVVLGIILITVPVRVHDSGLPDDSRWVATCGLPPGDPCGDVYPDLVAHVYTPVVTAEVMTWGAQVKVGRKCAVWAADDGLSIMTCEG